MDAKKMRKSTGLNQVTFWKRVFVGQSGGCRYENGRRIPKTVQALLTIAYAETERAFTLVQKLRK